MLLLANHRYCTDSLKTNVRTRHSHAELTEVHPDKQEPNHTIGVEFGAKTVHVAGKNIKLQIVRAV